jgi:hypothetical protein
MGDDDDEDTSSSFTEAKDGSGDATEEACVAAMCLEGATGILCGSCEDGYTPNSALATCVEVRWLIAE